MSPNATGIISLAKAAGVTLATAESLTGGRVCAALTAVPGASAVVRGGIVAYDSEVKAGVLGVSPELLNGEGPVSHPVALAMARGVASVLGADVAVATTGAAGPEPHGGRVPGTVVVAVVGRNFEHAATLHIKGGRDDVVSGAVAAALEDLSRELSRIAALAE